MTLFVDTLYVDVPNDEQLLAQGERVLRSRLDGVISLDGSARVVRQPTVDPTVISLMVQTDVDNPPPVEEVRAMFRAMANLVGTRPHYQFSIVQWEAEEPYVSDTRLQAEYSV
jgi:hypothetical protein